MDVCTDQHTISQDWPTEESFERKKIFKWRDISDTVYKIKKVKYRKGKYGDSAILTLETKNGDELRFVYGPLNDLQKTCWKIILINLFIKLVSKLLLTVMNILIMN